MPVEDGSIAVDQVLLGREGSDRTSQLPRRPVPALMCNGTTNPCRDGSSELRTCLHVDHLRVYGMTVEGDPCDDRGPGAASGLESARWPPSGGGITVR